VHVEFERRSGHLFAGWYTAWSTGRQMFTSTDGHISFSGGKTRCLQMVHNRNGPGLVLCNTKNGLCHTILLRCAGLVPDDLQLVIYLGCPREVLSCGLNTPFLPG